MALFNKLLISFTTLNCNMTNKYHKNVSWTLNPVMFLAFDYLQIDVAIS